MFCRCFIYIRSFGILLIFLSVQGTKLVVPKNATLCPTDMVDVICIYPDVNEMVGGKPKYRSTRPTWIRNGVTLYPDGTRYKTTTIDITSEMLSINSAMMNLDEIINLRLGCYFTFTGSSERNTSNIESVIPPVVNVKGKPNGHLTSTGMNPVFTITTTPLCVDSFEYWITLTELDGQFSWNVSTNQATVYFPQLKPSKYNLTVFVHASYHGEDIKSASFHQNFQVELDYVNSAHTPYYSFLFVALLAIFVSSLY